MNVPETMNEVLDMSDDEGMKTSFEFVVTKSDCVFVSWRKFIAKMFLEALICFVLVSTVCTFHTYTVHLNHAVRKANAPEMLSDGEYISDVEEGICEFLLW